MLTGNFVRSLVLKNCNLVNSSCKDFMDILWHMVLIASRQELINEAWLPVFEWIVEEFEGIRMDSKKSVNLY